MWARGVVVMYLDFVWTEKWIKSWIYKTTRPSSLNDFRRFTYRGGGHIIKVTPGKDRLVMWLR